MKKMFFLFIFFLSNNCLGMNNVSNTTTNAEVILKILCDARERSLMLPLIGQYTKTIHENTVIKANLKEWAQTDIYIEKALQRYNIT